MAIHPDDVCAGMQGVVLYNDQEYGAYHNHVVRVVQVIETFKGAGHKVKVQTEGPTPLQSMNGKTPPPETSIWYREFLGNRNAPIDLNRWVCKAKKGYELVLGAPAFRQISETTFTGAQRASPILAPYPAPTHDKGGLAVGISNMRFMIIEWELWGRSRVLARFLDNKGLLAWKDKIGFNVMDVEESAFEWRVWKSRDNHTLSSWWIIRND